MTDEEWIKELIGKNDSLRAQVWQLRHALETAKHQARCQACELRAETAHENSVLLTTA
jgi:hypothetical protein